MINDSGGGWQDDDYGDDDYDSEESLGRALMWPMRSSQDEDDDSEEYQHETYRGNHDDVYDSNYDPEELMLEYELLRIPPEIRDALEERLRAQPIFVLAWLQAICASFPERKLIDVVREGDPRIFPPCLCTREASNMRGYLELIDNDDVYVREHRPECSRSYEAEHEAERVAQLEAFRSCRFQQEFASEGMLCNQPPIPLRVLDFLETQDLVNLSLVCKSTHQAAHLLFEREEAVAAMFAPSDFAATDRQAGLLRDIRLASLMHGTPEAIPGGPVGDQLIRETPAEPSSLRSVTWLCGGQLFDLEDELFETFQRALYGNAGKFSARRYRLDDMCVLEQPQIQALQAKLVKLQTENSEELRKADECEREVMRNLLSVVDDALAMREPVLLRAYHVPPP